MNKDVMVDILKELSHVLPRSDSVQYVVLLDCCAVHLSEPVLREFRRQRLVAFVCSTPLHCPSSASGLYSFRPFERIVPQGPTVAQVATSR